MSKICTQPWARKGPPEDGDLDIRDDVHQVTVVAVHGKTDLVLSLGGIIYVGCIRIMVEKKTMEAMGFQITELGI